jgi:hypothetical protein
MARRLYQESLARNEPGAVPANSRPCHSAGYEGRAVAITIVANEKPGDIRQEHSRPCHSAVTPAIVPGVGDTDRPGDDSTNSRPMPHHS